MDLFIQFGYGMMDLCKEFQNHFGHVTTILSPRDLDPDQIVSFSSNFHNLGGNILVDPQFYLPRADHERLISHDYWPLNYDTQQFDGHGRNEMMEKLAELNRNLGSYGFIVPGERAAEVDDIWIESQGNFYSAARNVTDAPLILTICLSAEAVRSVDQINSVMELSERLRPFGYYLVLEHPSNQYFVDDPIWITNALDLAAGLVLDGGKVIVGYSNQQKLIMACSGVEAIASGTWKNVRMFPLDKFKASEENDDRKRATWYYCPQVLSEFQLSFIELSISRLGLDPEILKPIPPTPYHSLLFESPRPTISGWKERLAFRHYLAALLLQSRIASCKTYDETISNYMDLLAQAEKTLQYLAGKGLRGGDRNFISAIEANRMAVQVLEQTHGPRLRRNWDNIIGE
jgi:hypothetical protein